MKQQDYNATLTHRLVSAAASDNPTIAMDRGCRLMAIRGDNAKAAKVYIKLYDKATAPSAADTPKAVFICAASSQFQFNIPAPLTFVKGLSYRLVTGNADNDNTAIASGDILNLTLDIDG